jgi:hypothetical protein
MKFLPVILIISLLVFSCSRHSTAAKDEILVEFKISLQEFEVSPPSEFKRLNTEEQQILLDLLSKNLQEEHTHLWMGKYISNNEPVIFISFYTTYVRNGKTWGDASSRTYKIKNKIWKIYTHSVT